MAAPDGAEDDRQAEWSKLDIAAAKLLTRLTRVTDKAPKRYPTGTAQDRSKAMALVRVYSQWDIPLPLELISALDLLLGNVHRDGRDKLTRRPGKLGQWEAVLAFAARYTSLEAVPKEAAKKATGVAWGYVRDWLARPDFQEQWRTARDRAERQGRKQRGPAVMLVPDQPVAHDMQSAAKAAPAKAKRPRTA